MDESWLDEPKPRTNGSQISDSSNGAVVTVLGKIIPNSCDRSGRTLALQSCGDNVKLQIRFNQPTMDLAGYVEIQGRILNKTEIECLNFVCFSDDMVQRFDADAYAKAANLFQKHALTA